MGFFSRRPDKTSRESTSSYFNRRASLLEARKAADTNAIEDRMRTSQIRDHNAELQRLSPSERARRKEQEKIRRLNATTETQESDSILNEVAAHSTRPFRDTFHEIVDVFSDAVPSVVKANDDESATARRPVRLHWSRASITPQLCFGTVSMNR